MNEPSPSISPSSRVRGSLVQALAGALALATAGWWAGALYTRLAVVEAATVTLQRSQQKTARALERVTVIVERLDRQQKE